MTPQASPSSPQHASDVLPEVVQKYIRNRSYANAKAMEEWIAQQGLAQGSHWLFLLAEVAGENLANTAAKSELCDELRRQLKEAHMRPTSDNSTHIHQGDSGVVQGVQGGTQTVGSTIGGSVGSSQTLTNVRASVGQLPESELKASLAALHTEVEKLVAKTVDAAAKERIESDYAAFVKEATSPKPRAAWLHLSSQGLKEAAEAVRDIAAPVTAAVGAVLTLLG